MVERKDGSRYERWEASVSLGYDGNGKRKHVTVYAATQSLVLSKIEALKQQVTTGTYSDEGRTVKEYLRDWLEYKKLQVKLCTYEYYQFYADSYIVPVLGSVKLVKLTTAQVRDFLLRQHKTVSPDNANKCRGLLNRVVKQAVQDSLIYRNVVSVIPPFHVSTREDVLWTNEEVKLFLKTASTHRLFAVFYLALVTGMRRGEILGLRWQDLQGNTVYIRQNLVASGRDIIITTPKTAQSIRRVVIDDETIRVLKLHQKQQLSEAIKLGSVWGPRREEFRGLVFTSDVGTELSPFSFYRTWYYLQKQTQDNYILAGKDEDERRARAKQIKTKVIFPHLRLHDLRHLHVSLLNKAGVDARTIADRVGHKNADFTLKRYAHVFEEQRQGAAIPLNTLLGETD